MLLSYQPFNDFWYRDCFYHSLAQIAGNHGAIDALLKDELIHYQYSCDKELPMLTLNISAKRGWKACLEEEGIICRSVSVEGILQVDDIVCFIRDGLPLMLPVDCFYISQRLEAYQKQHITHNLVVIGFHEDQSEFVILEHDYVNDLFYKVKTIGYEEALNAFEGRFSDRPENKYYLVFDCKHAEDKAKKHFSDFQMDLIETLQYFISSLPHLKMFSEKFASVIADDVSLDIIQYYLNLFTAIMTNKRVQWSLWKIIIDELKIQPPLEYHDVVNNWNLLTALTRKMLYARRNNDLTMRKKLSGYIRTIESQERIWADKILSVIKAVV